MSELSNSIKRLAEKFPGSTSELARQVRIDRSTLYKIMGGRRLPTEAQLQNLLSVLHATPAEYTARPICMRTASKPARRHTASSFCRRCSAAPFARSGSSRRLTASWKVGAPHFPRPRFCRGRNCAHFCRSACASIS